MGNPVQVQVLLSARKLREVHSGVWAADASLLAGRRITIRIYTAIAVGQAFRRNACMHFDSKAENILFYECFSAFFFLKTAKIPFVLTKILTNVQEFVHLIFGRCL